MPAALLLLSLGAVFGFGHLRGGFSRSPATDRITFDNLAVASNLASERSPARFYRLTLDESGAVAPEMHNRFPPGAHLLIGLAAAAFGGDLAADLRAARLLMLLFFAGAAGCAYLSLRRLTGHRWIALTATLLSCSSYYCWRYADLVATDGSPDLFGFLLTFHGVVVFIQEGRFRQLLVKTGIALLLGWHALAVVAPFALLSLIPGRRIGARPGSPGAAADPPTSRAFLRRRSLLLLAAALAFGSVLLTAQFAAEYHGLDGRTPVTELPSWQSLLYRTGLDEAFDEQHAGVLAWGPFLRQQFHRLGRMVVPYAAPGFVGALDDGPREPFAAEGVLIGAAATVLALVGAAFVPARMPFALLVLSGFGWALPMRGQTAFHDFETLYYLGVPLALWSLGLLLIRRLSTDLLLVLLSGAAVLVFLTSGARSAAAGYDPWERDFHRRVLEDAEEIRRTAAGQTVFVPRRLFESASFGGPGAFSWFLAGAVVVEREAHRAAADFVVDDERHPDRGLLTPAGRELFLYRRAPFDRPVGGETWSPSPAAGFGESPAPAAERPPPPSSTLPTPTVPSPIVPVGATAGGRQREMIRAIESGRAGAPAVRSVFDLYLREDGIRFFRKPCRREEVSALFFLHLFTHDRVGSGARRLFENRDFDFSDHGVFLEDACLADFRLPEGVASVRAGQWVPGEPALWSEVLRVDFAPFREEMDAIVSGRAGPPAARGVFDLWLDGRELRYFRADCRPEDREVPFFLDLHAADPGALPERRREDGFEDLDFPFSHHGVMLGGRCLVRVTLPDYERRRLRTGQSLPDGDPVWQAEIPPGS